MFPSVVFLSTSFSTRVNTVCSGDTSETGVDWLITTVVVGRGVDVLIWFDFVFSGVSINVLGGGNNGAFGAFFLPVLWWMHLKWHCQDDGLTSECWLI